MPKRLLVLRHAKSSWEDSMLPDHERPLNDRGQHDARKVGKLLRHSDRLPELIVSSTARRARKTAQKVARASHYAERVLLYPELYGALPEQILNVIRNLPADPATLLVVGHNPGLEQFVARLSRQSLVMPTAALADLELATDSWQQLTFDSSAQLIDLWTPQGDEPAEAT